MLSIRQWGGVSLLLVAHHIAGTPLLSSVLSLCLLLPITRAKHQKQGKTGQNGAKVKIYLRAFVFSRDFARPKRAKSKDIFGRWCRVRGKWCRMQGLDCLIPACHWCRCAGLWLVPSFRGVFPAFRSLSCFAFGALLANMPLFRVLRGFSEGFMGFVWVYVVLVLCVACVAFVCVNS